MSDFIVLIPARFGSQRFPGKPLAKILNKEMIHYVIDNCKASGFDYAVVTDSNEIESFIRSVNGNVVRVDEDVSTGSERISLAFERYFKDKNYKYVLNVQGDEPLLRAELIREVGEAHAATDFDVYTAVKKRESSEAELFNNPNVVKCVFSEVDNKCLYFSRSSIPYVREGEKKDAKPFNWYQHIGVYSYKVSSLSRFVCLGESKLEGLEKLEQLRLLENGMSIGAKSLDVELYGVDTPEDIKNVERALSE